jgi:hypothetical protein
MGTITTRNQWDIFPSGLATYSAFAGPITSPASATDVFIINGAAAKIIKVWRIWVTTIQTTAGVNSWAILKRSTANTGGTAVATTKVPLDSSDAAASALVQHYTANPTTGTLVGNVWLGRVASPATATTGFAKELGTMVDFSILCGKPVVLSSAAEGLALNFLGVSPPTGMASICGVQWTEE